MPIPGPRNQFGPDPGYRNPGLEQSNRFNQYGRPGPIFWPGRTPGMMVISLRGCIQAAGQIRKLWHQTVNFIGAQAPYSWTGNGTNGDSPSVVGLTRALRYKTDSLYQGAGIDNTRYAALHSTIKQRHPYKSVTIGHGQVRSRPTVRNRLTSFGSRVPTINTAVSAAESQSPGGATQA